MRRKKYYGKAQPKLRLLLRRMEDGMKGNGKLFKQLRVRFVLWAMLAMLIVTSIVVGAINLVNYSASMQSIDGMLELISYNNGSIPGAEKNLPEKPPEGTSYFDSEKETAEPDGAKGFAGMDESFLETHHIRFDEETKYITRFFTVKFDSDGNIVSADVENIASFTEETAAETAEKIMESGAEKGREGFYCWLIKEESDGSMLVYLDCTQELGGNRELLFTSLIVAAASLTVELVILILLSGKVVRPVAESISKQKIFITDASHELKTPLTIISANVEVLEMTEGGNEWTESIKKQTVRMTKLVNDMVYLAKMDEDRELPSAEEFELSEAVEDVVLSFRTPAEAKGIDFKVSVEEGLRFTGNEAAVRQLLTILMDNALKYVTDKGEIRATLKKKNKHTVFEVYNTCGAFSEEDLPRLFERFYRVDKSRSRETGGSGIGLSVAKAIAGAQKNMSIVAETKDCQSINFIVSFK